MNPKDEEAVVGLVAAAHGLSSSPPSLTGLDLSRVWEIADSHRVLPSALHASRRILPIESLAEPLRRMEPHIVRQIAIRRLYDRIAESLDSASIRFVVVKGQALQSSYGDVLRPCFDLDLLVQPECLPRAAEILERLPSRRARGNRSDSCVLLTAGLEIDLHTRLIPKHFPSLPDTSILFERSKELRPGLRTLSDEDQLLLLVAHGFKHQWCRLVWILDLALFSRSLPRATVVSTIDRAASLGLGRAAAVAFTLAAGLLGAPIEAAEPVRGYYLPTKLSRRYEKRLFESGEHWAAKLESMGLHMLSLDHPFDATRYLAGRLSGRKRRTLLSR